jgi:hypothetical protein
MYRSDGTLEVGINVLPGVPRVVGVRRTTARVGRREPFHQAFMLPPSPALKTAGALVLPPAWFKKDRILEVQDGEERQQVRLLKVLMRGANFDQCSFEAVEQEAQPGLTRRRRKAQHEAAAPPRFAVDRRVRPGGGW